MNFFLFYLRKLGNRNIFFHDMMLTTERMAIDFVVAAELPSSEQTIKFSCETAEQSLTLTRVNTLKRLKPKVKADHKRGLIPRSRVDPAIALSLSSLQHPR